MASWYHGIRYGHGIAGIMVSHHGIMVSWYHGNHGSMVYGVSGIVAIMVSYLSWKGANEGGGANDHGVSDTHDSQIRVIYYPPHALSDL
jgi:hypothetical protein